MIGIVDKKTRAQQRTSHGSQSAFCYYGSGKTVYYGGSNKSQGNGFVQSDIVTV